MQIDYKPSIIIYSKMDCPACDIAKRFVEALNYPLEIRIIGQGWTKEQLLADCPNVRSVPQVLVDGIHIGNGQALERQFNHAISSTRTSSIPERY